MLLALAACAGPPIRTLPPPVEAGYVSPTPAPGYAVPAPQAPAGQPPVGRQAPAQHPPTLAELSADPTRFEGMTGSDVLGLMGAPSFRRAEPPAQVWQFYGGACVLDLFLYQQSDDLAVAHAELRSRNAGQPAGTDCMRQVLADRHKV